MPKSNTATAALLPVAEANAFADAYAAKLATYKAAFEAAKPGQDAAATERDNLRTVLRDLRWAAFDYVLSQPEGMREGEADAVAEQIATVDPTVKETSIRKMQQRMRYACVDYVSALSGAKRDKADPFSLAQKAHTAKAKADERAAIRDQFADRAMELAAADLQTTAGRLGARMRDGDVTATERYDAYLEALVNGEHFTSAFANNWEAADDATKAEVVRMILRDASQDLRNIALEMLA